MRNVFYSNSKLFDLDKIQKEARARCEPTTIHYHSHGELCALEILKEQKHVVIEFTEGEEI